METAVDKFPVGLQWRVRRTFARKRLQDLARQLGISATLLSQLERGERTASESLSQQIERALPPLPR